MYTPPNTIHLDSACSVWEYLGVIYEELMHVTSTINGSLFALTTNTEYDIHNCFDHFY